MRYGLRVGDDGTTRAPSRSWPRPARPGFGAEVKRRIILGTYALSSGYYDAYYGQAQKVRTLIARDFARGVRAGRRAGLADDADHGVPDRRASSTTRWRCTSTTSCTIPANLAGNAGDVAARPGWPPRTGCRSASRCMAPALADDRLYRVGAALEAMLLERWGGPLLDRAPELEVAR